jgi:hypothetical protein
LQQSYSTNTLVQVLKNDRLSTLRDWFCDGRIGGCVFAHSTACIHDDHITKKTATTCDHIFIIIITNRNRIQNGAFYV